MMAPSIPTATPVSTSENQCMSAMTRSTHPVAAHAIKIFFVGALRLRGAMAKNMAAWADRAESPEKKDEKSSRSVLVADSVWLVILKYTEGRCRGISSLNIAAIRPTQPTDMM